MVDIIEDDMQTKRVNRQTRMMLLPPLEAFIPKDHPIRRLNKVLDLSFVHDAVRGQYCHDNGRPSIDPEVIIRLFLLQAIEGIPHVRDLMRQVAVNLAYRWFIGYDLDEPLPDHSTLSRALDRFGDDVFNELFTRSIAQCKSKGLIEGRVLHLDATTIRADLNENCVNKKDSADPDARIGRFPDGSMHPGYKQQTVVDNKAKVILDVEVMPANEAEGSSAVESIERAIERTGSKPEAVCADSAYASGENAAGFEQRDIRLISPPRVVAGGRGDKGCFNIEEFHYDEEKDEFICPAGQRLRQVGRMAGEPHRRKYRASAKSCRGCSLKDQCTTSAVRCLNASIYHGAMVRLRADSKSEDFWDLYANRAPSIEGVFAEAKCWHGLRRAWRRGLAKMRIQSLLIAAVINLKRLIAFFIVIKALIKAIKARIVAFKGISIESELQKRFEYCHIS